MTQAAALARTGALESRRRKVAGAALACVALSSGQARASGLDAPWIGATQSGPTVADPAAVHWNPAELAWIERREVLAGAALVLADVRYQRDRRAAYQTPDSLQYRLPLLPGNMAPSKTGLADTVETRPAAPLADAFVAIPVLRDRLTVGAGFYVPYAAALHFPEDGAQAWQIREAVLLAYQATAAAGFRVNERVSAGAGLSYVGGYAELSRLQDFAGVSEFGAALASPPIHQQNPFGPDAPPEVRELEALSRPFSLEKAFSHGATFHLGLSARLDRSWRLALTYQHGAAMRYAGRFSLDMSDSYFTRDLASQGLRYPRLVQGDSTLSFSLPARLTLGASYLATRDLTLDGLASLVFYSAIDAFVVDATSPDLAQPALHVPDHVRTVLPRRWNDTVWLEARARYRASSQWTFSGSIGYQSPASPDSTIDAASPDGHRLVGALGAAYEVSPRVALEGGLRLQSLFPRTVTGSEHDLGNGTYRLFVASVSGHVRVAF